MSYQVKRIDPYWHTHPIIPVLVAAGAVLGGVGYRMGKLPVAVAGGALVAAGVFFATRVVVSAVLGTLGVFGGFVTFFVRPSLDLADMSAALRLAAMLFFALLYTVLMDALVLAVAVLYNLFSAGMGGLTIDLEERGEERP